MGEKVICNCCGKEMDAFAQDYLKIQKEWGYFSNKDLEIHEFYLCEACYDKMIKKFQIPVTIKDNTEVL